MRGLRVSFLIGLLISLSIYASSCNPEPEPRLRKVHTEHLGQLTGTQFNRSQEKGITGTDLGVSFMSAAGELFFLFGDSWSENDSLVNKDSAAWALVLPRPEKNKLPKLNWFGGNQFAEIKIWKKDSQGAFLEGGLDLRAGEVPLEGLLIDGKYYIFANKKEDGRYCCLVLAHTEGLSPNFSALIFDWKVDTDKFINMSAFVEGEWVWIFGSGRYRNSSIFLARVPPLQIADRSCWQYFQGMDGNTPVFLPKEATDKEVLISEASAIATAEKLVGSDCIGELSVRKHPKLGYLMLYNCFKAEGSAAPGIHLRRADNPCGVRGMRQ